MVCHGCTSATIPRNGLVWLLIIAALFLAGCEGFSTGDDDSDTSTDPGDANRVTLGGIVFDNRNSDQLASRAWYGSDVTAGEYEGLLDRDGFSSVITWTRDILDEPGREAGNDLPVQIYRTQIFDETGRLWRDYRQTLARDADADVYLLEYRETFFDQERSFIDQPRILYPRRDEAIEDAVFTDGLGYRWRVESTDATSPNGYTNCRRLVPLSTENSGAVGVGRVVQHTGDMYFHDDVGLVYVTTYDFSTVGVNIQPEPLNAGFSFVSDGSEPEEPPPPVEVTLDGISFASSSSANLTNFVQLGNLSAYNVRGYGGELVDTELRVQWEQRNVSVAEDSANPDALKVLPVRVEVITNIDLSDPDLPQRGIEETLVARSQNGDAYVLVANAEGIVTGLQNTLPFARGSINAGDIWQQSDGRTYRVVTTDPSSQSPTGHDNLDLILEVTADADGPLEASQRPRLYYDVVGYAEESIQGTLGRYRTGSAIAPPLFTLSGVNFSTDSLGNLAGLPQLGDLSTFSYLGYGDQLVDERHDVSWTESLVNVAAEDGLTYAVTLWRRDVRSTNLADQNSSEGLIDRDYVALAVDGNAYEFAVAEGTSTGLTTTDVYARGTIAISDIWTQADGFTYEALPVDGNLVSPSGHTDIAYLLTILADESEPLESSGQPRLYFDVAGLAEESIAATHGRYRTGPGISPPEPEPVRITLSGVEFDPAAMGDVRGFTQLGALVRMEIYGYGTGLPGEQLTWTWEENVAISLVPGLRNAPLSEANVTVRREIIRDISDPNVDGPQRLGTDIYLAQATNGNVYRLLADDSGRVDRLQTVQGEPVLWAKGALALGEQWLQGNVFGDSDLTGTYEVLTNDPLFNAPTGHGDLLLIISQVGDSSQRIYYDAAGFVDMTLGATGGIYRDNVYEHDDIAPPIIEAPSASG